MIRDQAEYLERSAADAAFHADQDYRQAENNLDKAIRQYLVKYGDRSDIGMHKARQDPRIADLIAERNKQIQLTIMYTNQAIMYAFLKAEGE